MSDLIAFTATPRNDSELGLRWHQLRCEWPDLKAADAAALLGVSEAELLASECGRSVTRLNGDWAGLLDMLAAFAPLTVVARNRVARLERTGRLARPSGGHAAKDVIDLAAVAAHWHAGFASEEVTRQGSRLSLRFFTADGVALDEIQLSATVEGRAFARLVQRFRHADQSPVPRVASTPAPAAVVTVDAVERRKGWAMPVRPGSVHDLLVQAVAGGVPFRVCVHHPGGHLAWDGGFARVVSVWGWTYGLGEQRLQLNREEMASAWCIRLPDGNSALDVYDGDGRLALTLDANEPQAAEAWNALLAGTLIAEPQPLHA